MTSALVYRIMDSPIGPLTLAGRGTTLVHLRMTDQTHEPDRSDWQPAQHGDLDDAVDQLTGYFAGELTAFDLTLEMAGTPFQRQVWAALREIPYGQTRTYGEIAAQIGSAGASRAVGLANGRNPIAIVVPCHRVIGSGGAVTGYGGGIERKIHLLELERKFARNSDALF